MQSRPRKKTAAAILTIQSSKASAQKQVDQRHAYRSRRDLKHTTSPSTAIFQTRSCHLTVSRNAAGQSDNFGYLAIEEAIGAQALRRALRIKFGHNMSAQSFSATISDVAQRTKADSQSPYLPCASISSSRNGSTAILVARRRSKRAWIRASKLSEVSACETLRLSASMRAQMGFVKKLSLQHVLLSLLMTVRK